MKPTQHPESREKADTIRNQVATDIYFSADVETDGPIPGPYSMLAFAIVPVGTFDGQTFSRVTQSDHFRAHLRPISPMYDPEALAVNGIKRDDLFSTGEEPSQAMTCAAAWVNKHAQGRRPILVAYPLSFDWTWLYWYFVRYSSIGSPFSHSAGFDVKTAFAVKARLPMGLAGRSHMPAFLRDGLTHTHDPLDDAVEQGEMFARLFAWSGALVDATACDHAV